MAGAFGIPKLATGLVLAVITGIVIFGGIRQIATVAGYVVPVMAGIYLLMALYVLLTNLALVPGMLAHIVRSAFGLEQAAGGVAGGVAAAMANGIKRGLFSNEAIVCGARQIGRRPARGDWRGVKSSRFPSGGGSGNSPRQERGGVRVTR